jgi:hypothetical protein
MIIWGWCGREIEVERSDFHCPQCNALCVYRRMRVATYFTLYFIPLFETRHHGDYVQCLNCGVQLRPELLEEAPKHSARPTLAAVRQDLEMGTATQTLVERLVRGGMEVSAAKWLVGAAAGEILRDCKRCGLSFADGVQQCSSCGDPVH